MRRPIVIIIGFIVLVFVILILLFGLKGPEMPIQEVHKVIPMSKFQQQLPTQAIPTLPNPANNAQPVGNVQQPIPAMPQPGAASGNAIGNSVPPVNSVPQVPLPAAQQENTVPNVATGNTMGQQQQVPQSTVPLIIPQQNNSGNTVGNVQQPIPAMPQPGAVPGNNMGAPAQ